MTLEVNSAPGRALRAVDQEEGATAMGLAHPKYKVAVVQAAPAWLDLDASIRKTIGLIEEAADKGARLIAFPEVFIPGYPWHIWMDSPAWCIGRGFVQRYFDNSLAYDSPQAEALRAAVRKAKLTAVLGLSERDGGSLYIAQWLIGSDGETIAKRRKLRPTHAERTVYGEGDGSDLAVHDRPDIGRIGALCCWEHLQPLSKYAMYAQNELGRASPCTIHSRRRSAPRSTMPPRESMRWKARASCWRRAQPSRRR